MDMFNTIPPGFAAMARTIDQVERTRRAIPPGFVAMVKTIEQLERTRRAIPPGFATMVKTIYQLERTRRALAPIIQHLKSETEGEGHRCLGQSTSI